MIPAVQVFGESKIPEGAQFWKPQLTENDDEGIGFFRDVWTIIDVTPAEAKAVIASEKAILDVVDQLADSPEHFDRLAYTVEWWNPDEQEPDDLLQKERNAIESVMGEHSANPLESLELGVAGLVLALAASGAVTAASCRGHATAEAWSEAPVVYFAAGEATARALEPLVDIAGCVFSADATRPQLLCVGGRSNGYGFSH
jgi:hypothetical protein